MAIFCLLPFAKQAMPQGAPTSYVNWETPVVHPVDLSPDGAKLAVVNLPDARLAVFDVSSGSPMLVAEVPVGLDPVSVRFRTPDEVWVVNHISDSVSVVDLNEMRVVATIQTRDEPADVVFAGTPERAFVSCSQVNTIQVFDPVSRSATAEIAILGEDPRALAVSPDGSAVYAAIFESGNATTILNGDTPIPLFFHPNAVSDPDGPYGGQNPPPNDGVTFNPSINPALPPPPVVGLIVKKDGQGRWLDDNEGDWTNFVSGPLADRSGRPQGWDMPDHDVAIINTSSLEVDYVSGLMNICMSLGVNPATGDVTVVGTDAMNHIRYEPNLQGTFLRVIGAAIDPTTFEIRIGDLNGHLDYTVPTLPQVLRDQSIGDPRGIAWNAAGTRVYITGMGSNNLLIFDVQPPQFRRIDLGEGPTGLALDEARGRLYVLNRFESSLSVIDTATETEIERTALFDPTPESIQIGRQHLYDTHQNSGLGHIACASCHVDARLDRLAWDLGDPAGEMKPVTSVLEGGQHNLGANTPLDGDPDAFNDFHPMKGPMSTQTRQAIIGLEPFHWRGDKDGLEEFNAAFIGLQGDDDNLTAEEMQAFEDFLATITYPPNTFRTFDNDLPTDLPLPGHLATGLFADEGGLQRGDPLPNGNALAGLNAFACVSCHTTPTGASTDMTWDGNQFVALPPGPLGEHHLALQADSNESNMPMKVPQLRNLYDRVGFDMIRPVSLSGFGFRHDGSLDTLSAFISARAFPIQTDQDIADLTALLLSFFGSDLPPGSPTNLQQPPGPASQDTHAAAGKQVTVTGPGPVTLFGQSDLVAAMIALADAEPGRLDLIVKATINGLSRGGFYDRMTDRFLSDHDGDAATVDMARQFASPATPLTYTLVPRGTGRRLGIDRDEDGFGDQTERDAGTDPADPADFPQ